jgi:predicted RNase H-like nuclease
MAEQENIMQQCFVCKKDLSQKKDKEFNKRTHLPVCVDCKSTEAERKAEKDALDSLAEGFICGCI